MGRAREETREAGSCFIPRTEGAERKRVIRALGAGAKEEEPSRNSSHDAIQPLPEEGGEPGEKAILASSSPVLQSPERVSPLAKPNQNAASREPRS